MKKRRPVHPRKTVSIPSYTNKITHHGYRYLSILFIAFFFIIFPAENYYTKLQLEFSPPLVRTGEFEDFQPSSYPLKISDKPHPYFTAESVLIRDLESSVPMFELNINARLRPASITKLMTALVALDHYDLDQILTVENLVPNEQEADMGLKIGDKLTVRNLLHGLLVRSGNDAAMTLADNFPGGIENFVSLMNQKALELNMNSTRFENPTGLDSPGHLTTAGDLSLLATEALKNDFINQTVRISYIKIKDFEGNKVYELQNINQLLGYTFGVDGVKTGYTQDAGQCLITSVSRNNHRIIIVLLKSQDRFGESAKLIEWVFGSFRWLSSDELLKQA